MNEKRASIYIKFKALSYNVPHGKKIGGLTALTVYKDLMANEPLTPEKIRQAQMLSWCIEIVSTYTDSYSIQTINEKSSSRSFVELSF